MEVLRCLLGSDCRWVSDCPGGSGQKCRNRPGCFGDASGPSRFGLRTNHFALLRI